MSTGWPSQWLDLDLGIEMKLATGVDLIEIARIEEVISRHGKHYLERIYTPAELEQCAKRTESLAGRFAAKEAAVKALGCGIGDVSWKEIEIRVNNPRKRPVLILHGAAAQLAQEMGLTQWDVSLTHTREYASAMAVAIGD